MTYIADIRTESNLKEAMKNVLQILEPDSLGILCRKPLLDEDLPEASDIDLLSIWNKPEESVNRIIIDGLSERVFVDVLWIPAAAMLDSTTAASYRMLPHLLLESEIIWVQSKITMTLVDQIKNIMHEKAVWERRLGSQIGFGDAALEEASRNLDFPPASLFFLQMASSYYMTALADCLGQSVMSLLTRPIAKLKRMDVMCGSELEKLLIDNLHLDADPTVSLESLGNLYEKISSRCAAKRLQGVNARTRSHYNYSVSPIELEYRENVAAALIRRGDYANANYYLRFWAYSLARCPIVLKEANEGKKPSFYVPFRPLKESVLTTCPEILDDLALILGGDIDKDEAERSIKETVSFRKIIKSLIKEKGLTPPYPKEESINSINKREYYGQNSGI